VGVGGGLGLGLGVTTYTFDEGSAVQECVFLRRLLRQDATRKPTNLNPVRKSRESSSSVSFERSGEGEHAKETARRRC